MADATPTITLVSAHTLTAGTTLGQAPAITLASAHGLIVTPGVVPRGHAVLATAGHATLVVHFGEGSFATTDRASRQASYDVIGRAAPVVLTDVRGARVGQFSFVCLTDAYAASARALFTPGDALWFRLHPDPLMTGMWFVATRVSEERKGKLGSPVRVLTVDYVEVDPPS